MGPARKGAQVGGLLPRYGDGGVDFLPIAHLYKTQVRKLAIYFGVPKNVAEKSSSPQLWPGHKATDEIRLDYDRLDPVLFGLFDKKFPLVRVAKLTGVPLVTIRKVLSLHAGSEHKRSYPPMVRQW